MVDDFVHLGADFGEFAVPDRIQKQFPQRSLRESFPKDVEDLAAIGFSLFLDFGEQPYEDVTFAGIAGDDVPETADFLLADTVDTAEALLDPVISDRRKRMTVDIAGMRVANGFATPSMAQSA